MDTAIAAMADGFSLEGIVLAIRGPGGSGYLCSPMPGSADDSTADGNSVGNGTVSDGELIDLNDLELTPIGELPAANLDEGLPTFLAARFPANWSADSQVIFEIYGNLWQVLQAGGPTGDPAPLQSDNGGAFEQWQIPVRGHWLLITRMDQDDQPVAAVAVGQQRFSPADAAALGAVIQSVLAACSENEASSLIRHLIRAGTAVTLRSEGPDVVAEVNADWQLPTPDRSAAPGGRRAGLGRDPDPVVAVARAAAKACRPRCQIAFAGSSELEDVEVSIVIIRHEKHGLRLGCAVGAKGDYTAAAEAVFAASV